jgi:putative transposase
VGRAPAIGAVKRDEELTRRIRDIHETSRGTYGGPRMHAELAAEGIHVGRKRVARLMRAAHLEGVTRRRKYKTTVRDGSGRQAPDLVDERKRLSDVAA